MEDILTVEVMEFHRLIVRSLPIDIAYSLASLYLPGLTSGYGIVTLLTIPIYQRKLSNKKAVLKGFARYSS